MPPLGDQQTLLPSLLDRLLDPDSAGTAARPGYSFRQMSDAVRRDLEDLLNTRQSLPNDDTPFPELMTSVFGFGLPDMNSLNAISPAQREGIGRTIAAVVQRYEPRLRDVRAILVSTGDINDRRVEFLLEARLAVDPAPEIAFDTILELTTGRYSVKTTRQ